MDSLAQKFVRNHDMKVKEELERLLKEYGKLKEPWVFEMKDLKHLTTCRKHRGYRSQQRDDCSESVALRPTKCACLKGWICEDHPNKPWGHRGCGAAGELCKNPNCDKDPDSIFLSVHCRVQPGRGKPPVRKTSLNA
jgi:hypothetical protein